MCCWTYVFVCHCETVVKHIIQLCVATQRVGTQIARAPIAISYAAVQKKRKDRDGGSSGGISARESGTHFFLRALTIWNGHLSLLKRVSVTLDYFPRTFI